MLKRPVPWFWNSFGHFQYNCLLVFDADPVVQSLVATVIAEDIRICGITGNRV